MYTGSIAQLLALGFLVIAPLASALPTVEARDVAGSSGLAAMMVRAVPDLVTRHHTAAQSKN